MRHVRIFLLYFQNIVHVRSRAFVFFLLAVFPSLVIILFWKGATSGGKVIADGWDFRLLTSYYLLVIILGTLVMSHIEQHVANYDIKEGNLSPYLLKPASYYWQMIYYEFPYRAIECVFSIIVFLVFSPLLKNTFIFTDSVLKFIICILIAIFAYFLSFTFKFIIGMVAFWLTEIRGFYHAAEFVTFIFAGYVMPLSFFPAALKSISFLLPFSYMIYFPVLAFAGKFEIPGLINILAMQIFWLLILLIIYKTLWGAGIKRYTGVGQ